MTESKPNSWDRERIALILLDAIEVDDNIGQAIEKLTELLGSVRAEAVGWAWTEACSQHDRGMDPRLMPIPELLEKSNADLNPIRE